MDPADLHEWVSFDFDGDTYVFDLTFLASNWACIFGQGCLGILDAPAPELVHGCCTYGAHFTSKKDRKRVEAFAALLTDEQWQLKGEADKLGGAIYKDEDGNIVSHVVDGACVFLNRVGFPKGPGCALHSAALEAGERPLDWKPEVCWQVPLRLDFHVDDNEHHTYTLREWKRRDWGEGGEEFHWWCMEGPEAFIDRLPVYETMRDEIVEMIGVGPYEQFRSFMQQRGTETLLPHPMRRTRPA